jgi:hypothetical protein
VGDMDAEFAERIAVLETLVKQASANNEDMKESIHDVQSTLNAMREELARYRGFWGGAMLAAGAVWTFLTFVWDWLLARMKGEG